MQQHMQKSDWFKESDRMTLEYFDSLPALLEAESAAIVAESPEYNRAQNPAYVPPRKGGRKPGPPSKSVSFRLPVELIAWMRAQARADNRSLNNWLLWTIHDMEGAPK